MACWRRARQRRPLHRRQRQQRLQPRRRPQPLRPPPPRPSRQPHRHQQRLRRRLPPLAPTTAAAAKPTTAPQAQAAAAPTTAPATGAKKGGKLTWALEQDPVHLIPYGAVPTANHWGKEFMYDSLIAWDRDLQVQPALSTEWSAPDDHTYVFKLRQGVKFHDGNEVTADDVKWGIEAQANPPAPGIKTQYPAKITSVDAVDKYTVRINMSTGPQRGGLLRLAALHAGDSGEHLRQDQRPDPGHRHRTLQAGGVRLE